jgi:hypothetical protein
MHMAYEVADLVLSGLAMGEQLRREARRRRHGGIGHAQSFLVRQRNIGTEAGTIEARLRGKHRLERLIRLAARNTRRLREEEA